MKYVVGIDEVGRGPLAGCVTVCVVVCEKTTYTKLKRDKNLPALGKDSKKLKPWEREEYAKTLKQLNIQHVVVHISNTLIDTKGISFCIRKAIADGMKKLNIDPSVSEVLLDGGLKASLEFKKQKTIIKGDEKERIIAWASILAKVSRDTLMTRLHKKYPEYGFGQHKGYGTQKHRNAIKLHGVSPIHRRSFCKNITI